MCNNEYRAPKKLNGRVSAVCDNWHGGSKSADGGYRCLGEQIKFDFVKLNEDPPDEPWLHCKAWCDDVGNAKCCQFDGMDYCEAWDGSMIKGDWAQRSASNCESMSYYRDQIFPIHNYCISKSATFPLHVCG